VAIAEGNLTRATHHLKIGFVVSRQIGKGLFLVNSLVTITVTSQFAGTVADLLKRSGTPNLKRSGTLNLYMGHSPP
jgi:hypothetical protein